MLAALADVAVTKTVTRPTYDNIFLLKNTILKPLFNYSITQLTKTSIFLPLAGYHLIHRDMGRASFDCGFENGAEIVA